MRTQIDFKELLKRAQDFRKKKPLNRKRVLAKGKQRFGVGETFVARGETYTNLAKEKQPEPAAIGEILTPAEVAERLRVPESWVYEKTRRRCATRIPHLRVGRYIRFSWPAVLTWLQERAAG